MNEFKKKVRKFIEDKRVILVNMTVTNELYEWEFYYGSNFSRDIHSFRNAGPLTSKIINSDEVRELMFKLEKDYFLELLDNSTTITFNNIEQKIILKTSSFPEMNLKLNIEVIE